MTIHLKLHDCTYKYLGVTLDNKFSFSKHVDLQLKKANKRLYPWQNLMYLPTSLLTFIMQQYHQYCRMPAQRSMTYCPSTLKTTLNVLGNRANIPTMNLYNVNNTVYQESVLKLANTIRKYPSHPLHGEYSLLPSGRRFRLPKMRMDKFKFTFVPRSINMLNNVV